MPDLLLELFSEEIPARMQGKAADDLKKMVTDRLVDAGLVYEGARAFVTPRRLTLFVQGVPARQPDLKEERKGPRVGAPEGAIAGFLKAAGLSSIGEATIQKDPKKGDFYIALTEKPGRAAIDVIGEMLQVVLRTFPWPKSMRWGAQSATPGSLEWVRPLHSILATFGPETEEPEIVRVATAGVTSCNTTYGHRFMAPGAISVRRFDDYVAKLEKAKVVLDPARRREIILHDAKNLAFAQGYELVEDEGLLNEVAGLVEWPVVLMGAFEESFLTIPGEVIRATIRNNQKCFVVRDPNTAKLTNRFILTANTEAADGGKAIVAGNARVIRARLSDAKFFYETDLKIRLEDRLAKFKDIIFHEKLGTQYEQITRIELLSGEIAPQVSANASKAKRAGRLSKADLSTEVVGEFPEVQGTMGKYYAEAQNEDEAVAHAIEDHYRPKGPDDLVPADPVSIAVALADKMDALVGFWMIDEKPTGSKDPYALRRAALGVIRIVIENRIRVSLTDLVERALTLFVQFGVRPRHGYSSLGVTWDPATESGPGISWSDPPYMTLLNGDGFIDLHREQLGMHQILDPDLGGEDDAEEYANRSSAYAEFVERLKHLDDAQVPFMFYDVASEESQQGAVLDSLGRLQQKEFFRRAVRGISTSLLSFFHDRLKVQLREQGARHDLVDAVLALGGEGSDDLLLIVRRVEALGKFLGTDDGKSLLAGVKRAANILRIEEKKDATAYHGKPDPHLYLQPEERELASAILAAKEEAAKAVAREDFEGAMAVIARLRPHVDAFFEHVTVNVPAADRRENRLKLLNEIREATRAVADFSKIEG